MTNEVPDFLPLCPWCDAVLDLRSSEKSIRHWRCNNTRHKVEINDPILGTLYQPIVDHQYELIADVGTLTLPDGRWFQDEDIITARKMKAFL